MNASHYSAQGCKVQRVQELESNINTHCCRSASADRQATAQTILCIQHPLFPSVSIISQHYLLLEHSQVCANFRPPPRCFHAHVQKQITDQLHAMQEPATAPWGLPISDTDLEKLSAGLEPLDQDDKWRISVSDHHQNGIISIHVIRVGTRREIYVLFVNPNNGGGGSSSGAIIEAITWEQNKGGIHLSEEQAKKEVVMITRSILGCEYDVLPEYNIEDMFNHPGAWIGAK